MESWYPPMERNCMVAALSGLVAGDNRDRLGFQMFGGSALVVAGVGLLTGIIVPAVVAALIFSLGAVLTRNLG